MRKSIEEDKPRLTIGELRTRRSAEAVDARNAWKANHTIETAARRLAGIPGAVDDLALDLAQVVRHPLYVLDGGLGDLRNTGIVRGIHLDSLIPTILSPEERQVISQEIDDTPAQRDRILGYTLFPGALAAALALSYAIPGIAGIIPSAQLALMPSDFKLPKDTSQE